MENWLPVLGYEGLYEVSDLGRIKSLLRTVKHRQSHKTIPEKIKKLAIDRDGYPVVKLSKDGSKKHFGIHRLVASAFIPNPNNLPQVNHVSGVKTDNTPDNLEWCTVSENVTHAFRVLNKPKPKGGSMKGRFNENHNQSKPVRQLTITGDLVKVWPCAAEAARSGFTFTHISGCCRGVNRTHGGFKWEFCTKEYYELYKIAA